MRLPTIALASGALVTTLLLAACAQNGGTARVSGTEQSSAPRTSTAATTRSTATATFNAADATFATTMIPHDQQAIQLADVILGKDRVDERVHKLAQEIKDDETREIQPMTGWLVTWGMPTTESGETGTDGGNGMMSQQDMAALQSKTGQDAADAFLKGMIKHHQGAIRLAQSEIANGGNPDAIALAHQIVQGRTAEIAAMQQVLDQM